jgi:hypothetical protein
VPFLMKAGKALHTKRYPELRRNLLVIFCLSWSSSFYVIYDLLFPQG